MIADLLFLLFAGVLMLAALGVITARNPMHSVLFLILAFVNAAGLFVLMGAEFLGLLLVMVYVGAVAVMFLFVVMTIDINYATLRKDTVVYLPSGLLIGGILLVELAAAGWGGMFGGLSSVPAASEAADQNIVALGKVLFTEYIIAFQAAAIVLLIAMVGAIVLTHRYRPGVRRQDVPKQIARTREDSIVLTHPHTGQGVEKLHFKPRGVEKKVEE